MAPIYFPWNFLRVQKYSLYEKLHIHNIHKTSHQLQSILRNSSTMCVSSPEESHSRIVSPFESEYIQPLCSSLASIWITNKVVPMKWEHTQHWHLFGVVLQRNSIWYCISRITLSVYCFPNEDCFENGGKLVLHHACISSQKWETEPIVSFVEWLNN